MTSASSYAGILSLFLTMILSNCLSRRVLASTHSTVRKSNRCLSRLACADQRASYSISERLTASISSAFIAAALITAPTLIGQPQPAWADNSEVSRKAVEDYMDLETKGKASNSKVPHPVCTLQPMQTAWMAHGCMSFLLLLHLP